MQEPAPTLLALWYIGVIGGIEIDYRHNHTPLEGTYVRLKGNLGSIDGFWKEYEEYVDLSVDKQCVVKIKPKYAKELEEWYKFTTSNKKEIAEYERLKKKFGKRKSETV